MAALSASALARRAAGIRLVGLDVDGVLTDGRLYFGTRGETLKAFHVRDGFALQLLRSAGIELAIVTGRSSPIVAARARDLGIARVLQGQRDKHAGLRRLLDDAGCAWDQCAYMGDDWPDLSVLGAVGLAATVADAPQEVRRRAHWVAPSAGGQGAVRDLCLLILRAQGRLDGLLRAALQPGPVPGPDASGGARPGKARAARRGRSDG